MGGVTIGIQANPDLSAIIVGGVRVVIDLAISFVEFFGKLTGMLFQFEDYLPSLAQLARSCPDSSLVQQALVGTYADIIDFCQQARTIFLDGDGKENRQTSARLFLRQQWEPFESGFGSIKTNMQHHVEVLRLACEAELLSGQAEQLSATRMAEVRQGRKEKEELLNWISLLDFEEVHDNIYKKKHAGTGEWLLQTSQFSAWDNSQSSTLLWCYGKRKSLCISYNKRIRTSLSKRQLVLASPSSRKWTRAGFTLRSVLTHRAGLMY
jgi:hypothetical protein